ncbi:hypothetical protein Tco_1439622 [Tanacetum coccineum]
MPRIHIPLRPVWGGVTDRYYLCPISEHSAVTFTSASCGRFTTWVSPGVEDVHPEPRRRHLSSPREVAERSVSLSLHHHPPLSHYFGTYFLRYISTITFIITSPISPIMLRGIWDPGVLGIQTERCFTVMRLEIPRCGYRSLIWMMHRFMDRALLRARVNRLDNDRPFHRRTALLIEEEARLSRAAWARSMDTCDQVHSEGMSLWTTVMAQQSEIVELRAADQRRQTVISELLKADYRRQRQLAETLKIVKSLKCNDSEEPSTIS